MSGRFSARGKSPEPGLRSARVLYLLICLLSLPSGSPGASAIPADGDGYGVVSVGPESSLVRVVREGYAGRPQVVDQFRSPRGCRDLGGALLRVVQGLVVVREQDGQ